MSEQDTRDLIAQAQAGSSDAEAMLLQGHEGLVRRVARRYCTRHGCLPNADLQQAGRRGLLKAIRKFDLTRIGPTGAPIRFATCANKWIWSYIQLAVRRQRRWQQTEQGRCQLAPELPPDDMDCTWRPGETRDEAEARIRRASREAPHADECEADEPALAQAPLIDLAPYLDYLSAKEIEVLTLTFGLHDGIERCEHEVAEHIGRSRSYVARYKAQALRRLRTLMENLS